MFNPNLICTKLQQQQIVVLWGGYVGEYFSAGCSNFLDSLLVNLH